MKREAWGRIRSCARFRLRTMLVLVTLLAIVSAIIGRYLYVRQGIAAAVDAIKEVGGLVVNESGRAAARGDRIERVFLSGVNDEQIRQLIPYLARLPHLRQLDIVRSKMTDAGLAELSALTQLERLFVFETGVTGNGLASLGGRLPHLDIRQEMPDPVATGLAMRTIYRHAISALDASPDGRWLAAGDGRGKLWLWQLDAFGLPDGPPRSVAAHANWLFDVAFSADSRWLATGGGDDRIVVWEPASLRAVAELAGHTDDVHAVAFAQDDRKLVSAGDDRTVRIWDLASRTADHVLTGHRAAIPCAAASPQGDVVATGSRDGDIRLWNIAGGNLVRVLDGHTDDVMSVAFDGDGQSLVSASYDGTVRVWNTESDALPRVFAGHSDWVFTATFGPRGRLVSGGRDGTLRLWDTHAGRPVESRLEQGNISRVVAIPRGRLVAVASAEGCIRFWDRSLARCLKTIRIDFADPGLD